MKQILLTLLLSAPSVAAVSTDTFNVATESATAKDLPWLVGFGPRFGHHKPRAMDTVFEVAFLEPTAAEPNRVVKFVKLYGNGRIRYRGFKTDGEALRFMVETMADNTRHGGVNR